MCNTILSILGILFCVILVYWVICGICKLSDIISDLFKTIRLVKTIIKGLNDHLGLTIHDDDWTRYYRILNCNKPYADLCEETNKLRINLESQINDLKTKTKKRGK